MDNRRDEVIQDCKTLSSALREVDLTEYSPDELRRVRHELRGLIEDARALLAAGVVEPAVGSEDLPKHPRQTYYENLARNRK